MLVIVTAVMFHARLDSHRHKLRPEFDNRTVPPQPFQGDAAAALAETYDVHAGDVLMPLPQMNDCSVRRALDDAVIATLGLDGEMVATIRRSLAAEPSVTGKRYSGLL